MSLKNRGFKTLINQAKKRKVKPIPKNPADIEGARLDPTTQGSANVARNQEKDIVSGRTGKVTAAPELTFLQLQRTEGSQARAKAKNELERRARDTSLTEAERKKAEDTLKKMERADNERRLTRDIRANQTQTANKPVALAKTSADKTTPKNNREFLDEETGELIPVPANFYSMTKNQQTQYLKNLKARGALGEDLSDKGMADANKKRAAAAARKKSYGGSVGKKTVKRKTGGKVGKKKPRGVGCALRGYGRAMK
jgi:hypothetical protein